MRVFIAIDIDENVRRSLEDLQKRLRIEGDIKKTDVKWARPDSVHLTLKFLGEVEDKRIAELCEKVRTVADRNKKFELEMRSVGYFGKRSARVVWVGTGVGEKQLCQLQADLEKELAQAGWPEESRAFAGHLTVCRVKKSGAGVKLAQICENYEDLDIGTLSVDRITVYQSQLTPTGPIYTSLANCKLK